MTWNTSDGDRVLAGAEGELIREVLNLMVDELSEYIDDSNEDLSFEVGVEAFDSLTTSAKIATLRWVAEYLLEETAETLDLTAVSESAVYAIYRTLYSAIELEIELAEEMSDDQTGCCFWRSLAWRAYQEQIQDRSEAGHIDAGFPTETGAERNGDAEHWNFVTECLADCVLWDRDFEMDNLFLDQAPELAQLQKKNLGIAEDYYTVVAPDIRPEQLETTLESLRSLISRRPR
jgi:hypothetical protein